MVGVGKGEGLNARKVLRFGKFAQVWIVECFQMQKTLQTSGWQGGEKVVTQVSVKERK